MFKHILQKKNTGKMDPKRQLRAKMHDLLKALSADALQFQSKCCWLDSHAVAAFNVLMRACRPDHMSPAV